MDYDTVLQYVGDFGPYQKRLLVIIFLPLAFSTFGGPVSNFILGKHRHRCKLSNFLNDTYSIQDRYHASFIEEMIPKGKDNEYDSCEIIVNGTRQRCGRWVFDKSDFHSSATSEFLSVCENDLLKAHTTMIFYIGTMTSSASFVFLADIIGRRDMLCFSLTAMMITNIAMVFSGNMLTLAILRFLSGFLESGIYQTTFVIGLEMVGPSKRTFVGTMAAMMFCFGEYIMLLMAYFVRDWRWLQLSLSLPMVLFVSYWIPKILPESPRWLLARGRTGEALLTIEQIAKTNGAYLPHDFELQAIESKHKEGFLSIIKKLFSSPELLIRWCIIATNWFAVNFLYYGIKLNAGELKGDIYLNFFIIVSVEILGSALVFVAGKTGRRPLYVINMVATSGICVATLLISVFSSTSHVWIVALSMTGKMLSSLAFSLIHIYAGELFPTVVRSIVMGGSIFAGRLATLLVPYIYHIRIGKQDTEFPLLLYAVVNVVAAISSLFLPETNNKDLLETID